jgi:hypothetical protein
LAYICYCELINLVRDLWGHTQRKGFPVHTTKACRERRVTVLFILNLGAGSGQLHSAATLPLGINPDTQLTLRLPNQIPSVIMVNLVAGKVFTHICDTGKLYALIQCCNIVQQIERDGFQHCQTCPYIYIYIYISIYIYIRRFIFWGYSGRQIYI